VSRNRQLNFLLWALAVSFTPCTLAFQRPPEIKIEKKAAFLPAGPGQKPFNVTRHMIPLWEVQSGGPPKDGIPALNHPAFISKLQADYELRPSDVILGVEFNGVAKAYPVRILNWHEVVNDDVGDQAILVSWCPLCGSGVVYDPWIDGKRYTFGVSGLLYRRNLLLYDQETESLWSQLGAVAVTGGLAGTTLRLLPSVETTWSHWKSEHPQTLVLSFRTGYRRDYSTDPYQDYPLDRQPALVVRINGNVKLYPFSQLKRTASPVIDEFEGQRIMISFDSKSQTVTVAGAKDEPVPHFVAYLADARAFYPRASIFKAR
jgi:Protein of unknown function (DUF3179)